MLSVSHLSKSYGIQTILEDVSFIVNRAERVALVGANGSGKSTLLNLIAGVDQPDSGHVRLDKSARLGYLRQGLEPPPGCTVRQQVRSQLSDWEDAGVEVEALAGQMAGESGDNLARIMAAYDAALARFEALGGYAVEQRIEETLAHLGLGHLDRQAEAARLSGGEQTRLGLAAVLLGQPDILLLDEPTNHLDIAALEWLEGFLAAFLGAALIVSHDRVFLDRAASRVIELSDKTHRVTEYTGGYSDYLTAKQQTIARQWSEWKEQQAEVKRIRADIARTKEQSLQVERSTTPREPGVRRYAKKVAKKALSREKKLERYLESEERVEKPDRSWGLKLEFDGMTRSGQDVIMLGGLGHHYPGGGWLFRDVSATLRYGERIALLGANGSGKSTLLSIIVNETTPAEGSARQGASVQIGYMPQKQDTLDPAATPLGIILAAAPISETEARNFLHFFLFGGDAVLAHTGDLSYGERARLLLARLVIGGANCLILDEPVNHLDIPSRERFEEALDSFSGTVLAAAHDRAFIDRFASGIWALEGGKLKHFANRIDMNRQGAAGRSILNRNATP